MIKYIVRHVIAKLFNRFRYLIFLKKFISCLLNNKNNNGYTSQITNKNKFMKNI